MMKCLKISVVFPNSSSKNSTGYTTGKFDPLQVIISGALFILSLSILILNYQYEEGARYVNIIRVTMVRIKGSSDSSHFSKSRLEVVGSDVQRL